MPGSQSFVSMRPFKGDVKYGACSDKAFNTSCKLRSKRLESLLFNSSGGKETQGPGSLLSASAKGLLSLGGWLGERCKLGLCAVPAASDALR